MKFKNLKSIIWIVKLQWSASKLSVIWGILLSIFDGVIPIAKTFVLASLFASVSETALKQADPDPVYVWFVLLLLIELLSIVVFNIDRLAKKRFRQLMNIVTSEHFLEKIYNLSQEQFDDEAFNTKLDRAREGLYQLWGFLDEIYGFISSLISFVGSITVVLITSPVVGLLIFISIIPVVWLQMKENTIRERTARQVGPLERTGYRLRWYLMDTEYMPEVRLMNAYKKLTTTWSKHIKKAQDIIYKDERRLLRLSLIAEAVQPTVSFGANLYFFRLLLLGSIGLDRFIFLRGMLEQASNSASAVGRSVRSLHEMTIGLQNFGEIFDTSPSIPDGKVKANAPLNIEFKNVCFSYPGSNQMVLENVSFVINPGSRLALVGENGAGKSTIIKLLLRQYLPNSGSILVNGTDIRDLEIESYYRTISNLSQNFTLISDLTIRDNLTVSLSNELSDEEIYKATDLVDITNFIKKLPHKLNSRLDNSYDDGRNVSGGQRQRLAIARALLNNGDIMILDEPTSAIDAKAEYKIFNNIYEHHAGKTTLIVSHRFSAVRKTDTIIVLDKGKIIESGSHEELIKHGGLYKEMFELQAEGYR